MKGSAWKPNRIFTKSAVAVTLVIRHSAFTSSLAFGPSQYTIASVPSTAVQFATSFRSADKDMGGTFRGSNVCIGTLVEARVGLVIVLGIASGVRGRLG